MKTKNNKGSKAVDYSFNHPALDLHFAHSNARDSLCQESNTTKASFEVGIPFP